MAIHVSAHCDAPGCGVCQPLAFDGLGETFGDVLEALADAGWRVEVAELGGDRPAGVQRRTALYCPAHAKSDPVALVLDTAPGRRPGPAGARPVAFELASGDLLPIPYRAARPEPAGPAALGVAMQERGAFARRALLRPRGLP